MTTFKVGDVVKINDRLYPSLSRHVFLKGKVNQFTIKEIKNSYCLVEEVSLNFYLTDIELVTQRRFEVGDEVIYIGSKPDAQTLKAIVFKVEGYNYRNDAAFIKLNGIWCPAEEFSLYKKQEHNTICTHDMKQYVGFTESYKYCTKCNHKE